MSQSGGDAADLAVSSSLCFTGGAQHPRKGGPHGPTYQAARYMMDPWWGTLTIWPILATAWVIGRWFWLQGRYTVYTWLLALPALVRALRGGTGS